MKNPPDIDPSGSCLRSNRLAVATTSNGQEQPRTCLPARRRPFVIELERVFEATFGPKHPVRIVDFGGARRVTPRSVRMMLLDEPAISLLNGRIVSARVEAKRVVRGFTGGH